MEKWKERVKDVRDRLEFASDDGGQGFIEYIILFGLVLMVVAAVMTLIDAIRQRFIDTAGNLDTIPGGYQQ